MLAFITHGQMRGARAQSLQSVLRGAAEHQLRCAQRRMHGLNIRQGNTAAKARAEGFGSGFFCRKPFGQPSRPRRQPHGGQRRAFICAQNALQQPLAVAL